MLQKQKKARVKLYVEQRMQDFIKKNNLKKIEKTQLLYLNYREKPIMH